MTFLLDTNCMVAMVSPWHGAHEAVLGEWKRRIARQRLILAAPCWAEAFSVLTRLPPPRRFAPAEVWKSLTLSWQRYPTVALTAQEWLRTLEECARVGIGGARVYDELIAACARKAEVRTVLTLNPRHFERHAGAFAVCVPGAA